MSKIVIEFKYLFTPIDVGTMRLRNRIVSSPHGDGFATNHLCDEREVYYQTEKAKGGAAMLCSGVTEVNPKVIPVMPHGFLGNFDDSVTQQI